MQGVLIYNILINILIYEVCLDNFVQTHFIYIYITYSTSPLYICAQIILIASKVSSRFVTT